MKTLAYIRVSTSKQDVDAQRLEILDYANTHGLRVDDWVALEISSRRSMDERGITALLDSLDEGDTLIVADLSRLGRSLGQVIEIVNRLVAGHVALRTVKEGFNLDGRKTVLDIAAKTTVALFGLMAEIERDLISQRTKAGLMAAQAKGKRLGRPAGPRASKLDQHADEIRRLLAKGVSQASLAKMFDVSRSTMQWYVTTRLEDGCADG